MTDLYKVVGVKTTPCRGVENDLDPPAYPQIETGENGEHRIYCTHVEKVMIKGEKKIIQYRCCPFYAVHEKDVNFAPPCTFDTLRFSNE